MSSTYKCIICEKEKKKGHSATARNLYCSNLCQGYHRSLENYLLYLDGKISNPSRVRKYTLESLGNSCSVCGISVWQDKPISLELDHVDGNSNNNHPKNLRIICPNCHSQTITYKAKNKGNGRFARMQRYHENKSY
jgi:5-methylcytosine-specific restriction endonuclease McrA